jgi:HEPN domain-containing protein
VTQDELARSYLTMARQRRHVLNVLLDENAHSVVVRESQAIVELALKAMLRHVGIDPPKWHDVGGILVEQRDLFPTVSDSQLAELARISKWLRAERELAFYGEIDFIPTEQYTQRDADRAARDACSVLSVAEGFLEDRR